MRDEGKREMIKGYKEGTLKRIKKESQAEMRGKGME